MTDEPEALGGEELAALMRIAFKVAQKYLRPHEDLEDVAHEAVVVLLEKLVAGEPVADRAAFVARVARNQAVDVIRGKAAWQRFVKQEAARRERDKPGTADLEAIERELRRAVEQLPPQQATCFFWHVFGGMSVKDIAKVLGIQPATVKTHLSRARAAIWRELN